jgi:hypothetical protein
MKTWIADLLMCALLVVCIAATVIVVQTSIFAPAGADLLDRIAPVHAAPVAKMGTPEPVCVPIGATGNIVISRCTDPDNGRVLYVNNIGMMAVAP